MLNLSLSCIKFRSKANLFHEHQQAVHCIVIIIYFLTICRLLIFLRLIYGTIAN